MADKQHIFKGSGAPVSAPTEVGHHYVDLTNNQMYFSTDILSASDWTLLGAGGGGGTWGSITGTLSSQTDLQTALNAKQATITGAASTVVSSNLTVDRLVVSNGSGKLDTVGVTSGEAFFLAGVTSNIQTQLNGKLGSISGSNSRMIRKTSAGVIESDETFQTSDIGEFFIQPNFSIADGDNRTSIQLAPIFTLTEDAPGTTVTGLLITPSVEENVYELGRNGAAVNALSVNFVHNKDNSIGGINLFTQNFSVGNGVDAISVKGIGYAFGFGQINANVTVDGPVQGYGFQPTFHASSIMTNYITAFYDTAQVSTKVNGYQSFNVSPQLAELANNNNATFINVNPTISSFEGNAGANGISIGGTWEGFGTGGVNFLSINPTAGDSTARYANGIWVDMQNVDTYPGVQSVAVIQDLTLTFTLPGDNNSYSVQYLSGGTAGSEVVALNGSNIEITLDSGVSTATQVKAALDGSGISGSVTTTISGTGSNPQTASGPVSFAGGENVGSKLAGYFGGNVQITGSLTFGGALSIGILTAFGTQALVDGGGTPSSIHSLITNPTVAANATLTSADTISVNTAALINIGANATVGTSFIGVAALGLPAVLTMGAGSTLDRCYGALFALSLDAAAGGGTVDEVGLCKSIAIPNGATTVNNLYGYLFDLPFGDPGTKTFGFYDRPGKNNYLAGQLLIGGTAGSDDLVTNSSVALEIKSTTKAFMNARMTTTERNALTAVNGMQIYNSTTDKLQVYAGGSWVDLH